MLITFLLYFQSTSGSDSTGAFCCGGTLLFIVIIVVVAVRASDQQTKALNSARDAYYSSLAKLKKNPTSADQRQTTLGLGRNFSNLTRSNKGVTIFDEVALSNDINAACAGATRIAQEVKPIQAHTIESRLTKLAELKSRDLITEEEYNSRKQQILNEL